jgi:hypothetical protein
MAVGTERPVGSADRGTGNRKECHRTDGPVGGRGRLVQQKHSAFRRAESGFRRELSSRNSMEFRRIVCLVFLGLKAQEFVDGSQRLGIGSLDNHAATGRSFLEVV